jgi:soluble lytic murein transglycosylase-like protein
LATARNAWRKYKQRWFYDETNQRAPLNKLLRKQNPEDIIADVSKKSAVSDEYAKVLGGLEPNKLATEMADFAQQPTVESKLKWIQKKRAVYADSPIWPVVQQWESVLNQIKNKGELAAVEGLNAENINVQANSLVRALGGKTPESAVVATARDVGSVLSGAGLMTRATSNIPVAGPMLQKSTNLTAQALTEALKDPATALQYMFAGQQDELARAATQTGIMQSVESGATRAGQIGAALSRGLGMFEPTSQQPTPTVTPTSTPEITMSEDEIKKELAVIKEQIASKKAAKATPAPAPESVKVGKQEINAIIDDVASKYKVPAAELKAIAQIESNFNPKAVGPKTRFGQAEGAMQLMPATAKALGVKDPFDARQSIEGASKLLLELENTFGKYNDRRFIWAAYNSRPILVQNAIRKVKSDGEKVTWGNVSKHMPSQTKNYVKNVLRLT